MMKECQQTVMSGVPRLTDLSLPPFHFQLLTQCLFGHHLGYVVKKNYTNNYLWNILGSKYFLRYSPLKKLVWSPFLTSCEPMPRSQFWIEIEILNLVCTLRIKGIVLSYVIQVIQAPWNTIFGGTIVHVENCWGHLYFEWSFISLSTSFSLSCAQKLP